MVAQPGEIVLNEGRETISIAVTNLGDRPIQVGSHYHFFETNRALSFDRGKAYGMRLDIPAGNAVRFEPGERKTVQLVSLAGAKVSRGGNALADGPIEAPPVISHAWSAIAMHDEFWAPIEPKLREHGLVLVNDSTFTHEIAAPVTVHRVPATTVAAEIGNPLGGSLVMLAAYAAATAVVSLDSLVAAMRSSIPPYRTQHIEANERALRAGWELLPHNAHPAWEVAHV